MTGVAWAFACVLVLLALAVFAVRVRDLRLEDLVSRWAQPPSRFLRLQGMEVHLRDEGWREDPLPLVLLHGTSASLHTWDGWVEGLSGQRRVVRFDLPGFGLTGPHPGDDYRIDTYVAFVVAVLDAVGVQRCALAGNSLGGQIAWNVAAMHPDRVDRLVLIDAAGYPLRAGARLPLAFRLARTPGLSWLVEHTSPPAMVAMSVRGVYGDPGRVTPRILKRYRELSLREGNRRALVRRLRLPHAENTDRIRALKQSTLILWGGRDRLFPVADARRFESEIENSELVLWDDLGHVPHEEDAAGTLSALRRFLSGHPTAVAGASGATSRFEGGG